MKLAGGSSKLINMIDYEDFKSQFYDWDNLMKNASDRIIHGASVMFKDHPFPIVRAHEIDKWDPNMLPIQDFIIIEDYKMGWAEKTQKHIDSCFDNMKRQQQVPLKKRQKIIRL